MCERTERTSIDLAIDVQSAGVARKLLAGSTCGDHGASIRDDVALLASELVANAVAHGRRPVTMTIDCAVTYTEVRVRDGSPVQLSRTVPDALATSGRGLLLVDEIADRWGVIHDGETAKEVWFHINH